MTLGNRLLIAAAAVCVLALSVRAASLNEAPLQVQAPTTHRLAVPPGTSTADYFGSSACARCHQESFEQWERSLHVEMTKPIARATVAGDFSNGTRFADHGRAFEFGRRDGKPFMSISFGGRPPETFQVDYTLGAKRYQGYLSTLPDGRIYVLPAFWHIESRRWIDWQEITPIPDGAHDLRQIWNTNCFNCHATNLEQGFDTVAKRYDTTWTEMGVGCEACHGPGRAHVQLMDEWESNPASKPAYDNSATNRDLSGILKIFSPRSASPRQTFDSCAYCHGNKQNAFVGFRAGDLYEDYALPFLISAPIPASDFQGDFWPDGRPNRFNRPQALTLSGCFKAGQVACTNCHVAHGSRNPFSLKVNITQGRNGDLLCTQCHGTVTASAARRQAADPSPRPTAGTRADAAVPLRDAAIEAHTFHPAASAGSRCVSCHMSDVNWRLLIRRRDHTFQPPVPEMTKAFGVPNACTTCHDDRSPEWAARQMDQWWGDGERRSAALAVADTMYRAGSGDASVLPSLARLAIDRSQGMLVRASAVEFMQQLALGTAGTAADAQSQTSFADLPTGAAAGARDRQRPSTIGPRTPAKLTVPQINALIGAASDPEPTVRAHAIYALLASGDRDRIVTPLIARLIDPARVVRARAAEALLSLGYAQLPGKAGEALARAQGDYLATLTDFPDSAANHAARAWLELHRDRVAEAAEAVDTAIRLDPRLARPWVIKGVMAAREGRFSDAVASWRTAKQLEPGYPNIDQLIGEAEKRRK